MAPHFKFTNKGVTDFGDGAAPAADPIQPAFNLNNNHDITYPAGLVGNSSDKHPNIRRNGALFNEHRSFGVKGRSVDLDIEWSARTWLSKANKGDMHYLLAHAGLLTDEIRGYTGVELTRHMVKVREERAGTTASQQGHVASQELEDGEIDENEDPLVEDDVGGHNADGVTAAILEVFPGANDVDEEDPTLIGDELTTTDASDLKEEEVTGSMKQGTENTMKTEPNTSTGLSSKEAITMLVAIKDQARINIMYPYYDDRHRERSDTGFGPIIAYRRSTFLYNDDGEVLLSYEIQQLVQEIVRHRDVLRAGETGFNPIYGTEGPTVQYRDAMSRLRGQVKERVRDGEEKAVVQTIKELFAI